MKTSRIILFKDDLQRLDNVCLYIHAHLSSDLNLNELAWLFGSSPSKLKRQFKYRYKKSLREYILRCRMHVAHELIMGANSTIGEIALRVGYKSRTSFTHAFSTFFGYAPFDLLIKINRQFIKPV